MDFLLFLLWIVGGIVLPLGVGLLAWNWSVRGSGVLSDRVFYGVIVAAVAMGYVVATVGYLAKNHPAVLLGQG